MLYVTRRLQYTTVTHAYLLNNSICVFIYLRKLLFGYGYTRLEVWYMSVVTVHIEGRDRFFSVIVLFCIRFCSLQPCISVLGQGTMPRWFCEYALRLQPLSLRMNGNERCLIKVSALARYLVTV
jgi:hypothetical protein